MANAGANLDDEAAKIRHRAGRDHRIAFVSGNFNVVHPGHLRLLRFAAENGDYLVVGVNPDSTPGVTVPAEMRLEAMGSITLVNDAILLTEPAEDFIRRLQPEIVVKGKEYEGRHNREQDAVNAYGGKLIFSSGEMRFASFSLLQRDYVEPNFSSIRKDLAFPQRHGFTTDALKDSLARLKGARVLVVGDLIVDTYINCDPLGMSQEDPTIVVTPIEQKTFVGGAGIVAAHARGLGAEVSFITAVGQDQAARFAERELAKFGVEVQMLFDDTRPTTVKERYRANGKTLLRVNHLRQHAIDPDLVAKFSAAVDRLLPQTDLILFSDFNYGCLPQSLVDSVVGKAKERGIMMAADSQASSQMADISRFKDMTLVTPTEREARLALQDFESGLVIVSERLRAAARAGNVIITLGSEGLLVHAEKLGQHTTDRLPPFNTAPKDVAGAGDSLFTCASLAICAGIDTWQATYLGALAAACQVSRVGNLPLTVQDMLTEIDFPDL